MEKIKEEACKMEKQQLAEFARNAKQGNENAFTSLYEETHNSIYFLALKMLKNEQDALDVVQDTYISAFNNLKSLENPEIFSTWLHQIATNKCKDYLKKNKPVLFADDEQEEVIVSNIEDKDDDFIPHSALDKIETRHLMMEIIDNSLSDSQRAAVMLFYYEEMPVSKIAEILECSEGTVKSRLFSARKLIKAGVDEHEKKGTKLYSTAAIPLLTLLLRGIASEINMAPSASGLIIQNVMQQVNSIPTSGMQDTSSNVSNSQSSTINHTAQNSAGHSANTTNKILGTKSSPTNAASGSSKTIGKSLSKIIKKVVSAGLKTKVIAGISVAVVASGTAVGIHTINQNKPAAVNACISSSDVSISSALVSAASQQAIPAASSSASVVSIAAVEKAPTTQELRAMAPDKLMSYFAAMDTESRPVANTQGKAFAEVTVPTDSTDINVQDETALSAATIKVVSITNGAVAENIIKYLNDCKSLSKAPDAASRMIKKGSASDVAYAIRIKVTASPTKLDAKPDAYVFIAAAALINNKVRGMDNLCEFYPATFKTFEDYEVFYAPKNSTIKLSFGSPDGDYVYMCKVS